MVNLSRRLSRELVTECGHTLEDILERRAARDLESILAVIEEGDDDLELNNAIALAGRWGDPRAIDAIAGRMPSLSDRGLVNAIDALGSLGGTDAVREIQRYARHPSEDVRRFVVIALERVGSRRAMNQIARMARSDASGVVRQRARRVDRESDGEDDSEE